jgi:hypothetical protein
MVPVRHPVAAVDDLPWLVAAEFAAQPGLRLTLAQVQRLWNLPVRECQEILGYLMDTGQLVQDEDGQYCRPQRDY